MTSRRAAAPFTAAWSSTVALLRKEVAALGGRTIVLQIAMTEADFRLDGMPRANARATHPGVILSMESKFGPLSYPCDTFNHWQDNIRAIALSLEALRRVDRYGVSRRGQQYTGWRAIGAGPIGAGFTGHDAVLKTMSEAEACAIIAVAAEVEYVPSAGSAEMARLLKLAKRYSHPDLGGSRTTWDRVEMAARILGL